MAGVTATITDNDTAGVTVTPTSGLTTSEAGGTATFTVVLNTQPTADVTIGLSSSDTTEGTVSPPSVTFTPLNWNVPQTVTVTGVDDPDPDGDVAYTIVTAAAVSSDANYNGFNPADVGATNLDNEAPPGPSIQTYTSTDTPRAIPDRGQITSKFTISETFTIQDLEVKLTITHIRDADLDVFLVGPDKVWIELFTDLGGTGDHFINTTLDQEAATSIASGVAPFTGTFRPEVGRLARYYGTPITGVWKLRIIDDLRNQVGTLQTWSLVVTPAGSSASASQASSSALLVGGTGTQAQMLLGASAPWGTSISFPLASAPDLRSPGGQAQALLSCLGPGGQTPLAVGAPVSSAAILDPEVVDLVVQNIESNLLDLALLEDLAMESMRILMRAKTGACRAAS